ncbi:two-component regulator propeller domain-containing protein [Massilia aurea]|uniref:sensor histidine kinase n=1 Tax=Massilia aurea TaxID=373040 RepID=UPI003461A73A
MRRLLLVCLYVAGSLLPSGLLAAPARTLGQFDHATWTQRDGVPDNITAMAQTVDGWLWLGTSEGVWRFDGLRFTGAKPEGAVGFPDQAVYTLRADATGGLWIGWMFGGVSYFHAGKTRNWSTADGLPAGAIWSFAAQGKRLWAGGIGGLALFDGNRWQRMGPEQGFTARKLDSVFVDADGTVAAFTEQGLFLRPPGALRFESPIAGPGTRQPPSQYRNGPVWYLEQRGVRALDSLAGYGRASRWVYWQRAPVSGSLLADSHGALWFDDEAGLLRHPDPLHADDRPGGGYAPGAELFTVADGLTGKIVHCMLEDAQGNIWVATSGGLDRFRAANATEVKLATPYRVRLLAGPGGDVFVSDGNLTSRLGAGGALRALPAGAGAMALTTAPDGAIWQATAHALRRLTSDGERLLASVPYPADVAPAENIRSVLAGRGGAVWVVASGRGVLRHANGSWQRNPALPDGGRKTPIAMLEDAQGRVWIGYEDNQIALVEGDKVSLFGAAHGLSVGKVSVLLEHGGSIWAGGTDGLARLTGTRFVPVRTAPGDALRGLAGAVSAPDGIWLNGAAGLVLLPGAGLQGSSPVPARVFDDAEGIAGRARPLFNNSIVRATDGRIWVSTKRRLFWLDPATVRPEPVPAAPTLLQVTADGRDYSATAPATLPPNPERVAFRFATPSTDMAPRIRYQYRLEGYDRTWQQAGQAIDVAYTGLPPGDFRFVVQALNGAGVASPVSQPFQLHVPPTAVQTVWFKLACAALALWALWGVYRYRLRLHARRLLAVERTRHAERERIARELHDTLLQSVQGLVLRVSATTVRMPAADPLRASLTATLEQADAVLVEARDRVQGLRRSPPIADDLPSQLAAALAQVCDEQGAPRCHFMHVGVPRALPQETTEACIGIAIEAVRNACRHAQASNIDVRLAYGDAGLELRIADDGRGIDAQILHVGCAGHWGLAGMRERAAEAGCRLRIDSTVGVGTTVVLTT